MKFTPKIWLFVILTFLSFLSLFVTVSPFGITFLQKGVLVSSVDKDSIVYEDGLRPDMVIVSINGNTVSNLDNYQELILPYTHLGENETIRTEIGVRGLDTPIIGLYGSELFDDVNVEKMPTSKLSTGLDLQGGARAFVRVKGNVTASDIDDVISVLDNRLNTYGLTDMSIYKIASEGDEILIGIEIAGSSPDELKSLISEQGHFEAKIGNETVFIGGDKDVTYVARSGEGVGVRECDSVSDGAFCNFAFTISLSPTAADKFANATKDLEIIGDYLSENITFYIDNVETSALRISSDLRGSAQTTISISGSGAGVDQQSAFVSAETEMKKLQTILITGSLPFDLEVVKIDRISPNLGENFTKRILLAGLIAFIGVMMFVTLRYKKVKLSLFLIFGSFAEILMTLGIACLINWNLDLSSIAGIIAAIGTGIDSEIIILDESVSSNSNKNESIKQRIKRALFMITTAFSTTFVALLPLTGLLGFLGIGAASAGMLKGFAVTTIIGICIGVFISRPAFVDITKQLKGDDK